MEIEVVPVEQAVGRAIAHDLTMIDPESGFKGAKFRRGHTIRPEDIPLLKRMGKSNISFLRMRPGEIHEDEAALRLGRRVAGEGVALRGPEEGKCALVAELDGLLVYRDEDIDFVNDDPEWLFTTLPNRVRVRGGKTVAAFRIGPLMVREEQVARVESVAPISVLPFRPLKTALVTTGRELYEGAVKDAFEPKLLKKLEEYGAPFMGRRIVPDEISSIVAALSEFLDEGAELVLCTGGMSVDADDMTPSAIRAVCGKEVFRRIPAIPGANLMLAARGSAFVLGVPASVAFMKRTSLDMILDRIFAGIPPTGEEIKRWGRGGLCAQCESCAYPRCAFAAR